MGTLQLAPLHHQGQGEPLPLNGDAHLPCLVTGELCGQSGEALSFHGLSVHGDDEVPRHEPGLVAGVVLQDEDDLQRAGVGDPHALRAGGVGCVEEDPHSEDDAVGPESLRLGGRHVVGKRTQTEIRH